MSSSYDLEGNQGSKKQKFNSDPASLFDPAYMAEDGYHPSELAVDWMASEICATVKVAESAS